VLDISAKAKFHNTVRLASEKDKWTITHDPLFLRWRGVDVYIDLAAEKLVAAEKGGEKIAVEIKSFLRSSAIYELHLAVGQFINDRSLLKQTELDRILSLAMSFDFEGGLLGRGVLKKNE
jgi:hypothetical protein